MELKIDIQQTQQVVSPTHYSPNLIRVIPDGSRAFLASQYDETDMVYRLTSAIKLAKRLQLHTYAATELKVYKINVKPTMDNTYIKIVQGISQVLSDAENAENSAELSGFSQLSKVVDMICSTLESASCPCLIFGHRVVLW